MRQLAQKTGPMQADVNAHQPSSQLNANQPEVDAQGDSIMIDTNLNQSLVVSTEVHNFQHLGS